MPSRYGSVSAAQARSPGRHTARSLLRRPFSGTASALLRRRALELRHQEAKDGLEQLLLEHLQEAGGVAVDARGVGKVCGGSVGVACGRAEGVCRGAEMESGKDKACPRKVRRPWGEVAAVPCASASWASFMLLMKNSLISSGLLSVRVPCCTRGGGRW